MSIAHITKAGNIFIPQKWRDELGIGANVIMEKKGTKIIIEPLSKPSKEAFNDIDQEMMRKNLSFTREEAVRDDLYD